MYVPTMNMSMLCISVEGVYWWDNSVQALFSFCHVLIHRFNILCIVYCRVTAASCTYIIIKALHLHNLQLQLTNKWHQIK